MGRPSLVKDHVNYITKIENIAKHIKNTIFTLIYQFLVHYMVVNSTSFGSVFVAQMKALTARNAIDFMHVASSLKIRLNIWRIDICRLAASCRNSLL